MPVSLTELMKDASLLAVDQKRTWGEDAIEVVLSTAHRDPWMKALETVFGPARKPAGKGPSREDESLSAPWGGIRKQQTLFVHQSPGEKIVALLWPWDDKVHVTVKIGRAR